jgi:hypothetical protein
MTRAQMLAATSVPGSSNDWQVRTDAGNITFRPFSSIMSEEYRLYQRVEG